MAGDGGWYVVGRLLVSSMDEGVARAYFSDDTQVLLYNFYLWMNDQLEDDKFNRRGLLPPLSGKHSSPLQ